MPRKKVIRCPNSFYHQSARCNRREHFPVPMEEAWEIFERYLFFISKTYMVEILSFVLMPNHFHLLLKDPELQMGDALNYFMREVSKDLGHREGNLNHLWGSRVHPSYLDKPWSLETCYKYIYRNPVEANLCANVEDYPYSSIRTLLGLQNDAIPLCEDPILFDDIEYRLDWLNTSPHPDHRELVKKALRKSVFKLPRDNRTNKKSKFEDEPY